MNQKINIVFEGLPAVGKTSTIETIKNKDVLVLKEHYDTNFDYRNATVENYIDNDFYKSNMIKKNKSKILLSDRYYYTTIIHKCVREEIAFNIDTFLKYRKELYLNNLSEPDIIFHFCEQPEQCLTRILQSPRYLEEKGWWLDEEFLTKMSNYYQKLFDEIIFKFSSNIKVFTVNKHNAVKKFNCVKNLYN